MKRHIKNIFIFLSIIAGFLIIINLIIDNPYTHRFIRAVINKKVKEYTHLDIDFQALSVKILPARLDLYGLKIKTEDFSTIVETPHVKFTVSIWSILIDHPKIDLIETNSLVLYWPAGKDFSSLLKQTNDGYGKPSDGLSWPIFDLPINTIRLNDTKGYLEFLSPINLREIANANIKIAFDGANCEIDLKDENFSDVILDIQRLNVAENERILIEDASVTTQILRKDNFFRSEHLTVFAERLGLKGKFEVEMSLTDQNIVESLIISSGLQFKGDLSLLGSVLDLGSTRGETSGNININATIPLDSSDTDYFLITGNGEVKDGFLDGFRLFDASTGIIINSNNINFKEASIKIGQKEVAKLEGTIGFSERIPFYFSAQTNHLFLSDLFEALNTQLDVVDFSLTGSDVLVKGQGDPFEMEISASPRVEDIMIPLIYQWSGHIPQTKDYCDGKLSLKINEKSLDFGKTTLDCHVLRGGKFSEKKSQLAINGQIYFEEERIDLNIISPNLNFGLLAPLGDLPVSGLGKVKTRVYGPIDKVMTSINLDLFDMILFGLELGQIKGRLSVVDDSIRWDEVSFASDAFESINSSHGTYNFSTNDFLVDFDLRKISSKLIKDIFQLWKVDNFSFGIEAGLGQLKGNASQIGHALGYLDFDFNNLKFDDEILLEKITGSIKRSRSFLATNKVVLKKGTLEFVSQLNINDTEYPVKNDLKNIIGFLGLTGKEQLSLTIKSNNNKKNELSSLPVIGDMLNKINLQGRLSTELKISGTLQNPQGTIDSQIQKLTLMGDRLPPVRLLGFFSDEKLDMTFNHSGNTMEGRIKINLFEKNLPYEWFINIVRFDLRAFFTPYFYKDPRNYVYLSGNWYLKGYLLDWFHSKGSFQIDQIQAKYVYERSLELKNIHIINRQPVTLLFGENGWTFKDNKELEFISENIYTKISLPAINQPENFSMLIDSEIDLDILPKLTKSVESASGKILVKTNLSGPIDDMNLEITSSPASSATASDPLTLNITDMRPKFSDISFQITYKNGLLDVNHLTATKGGGKLESEGILNITGEMPVNSNFNISFKEIKILYYLPYLKRFDTVLNGDVQISGMKRPYLVTGDINIEKARSSRQFDIREEVVKALRQDSISSMVKSQADDPWLLFDLVIKSDRSIIINNQNLKLNVSCDLKISGNNEKPNVLGNITINKGKFVYRREFNIERGEITFDDPVRIDPKIDILALTDVGSYRVTIAATGTASQPAVELLVDPPTRDDGSVISRLDAIILLSRGTLPSNDQQAAQSQGVGVSELLSIYSSQLPFDQIFETYGQNFQPYLDWTTDEKGSPVLQLNVRFNIIKGVGGVYSRLPNENKISLEIPVHEGISSSFNKSFSSADEEDTTQRNEGSVDLRFRFSFD